jgi:microcystin-dependent protein
MEPFLGQVMLFGGNFAPLGWALCDGQLLPISENEALFSLLGTTYGGDGMTTFALPDLRGRIALHAGTGAGLPPIPLGDKAGEPVVPLSLQQMPAHAHGADSRLHASNLAADSTDPM